MTSENLKHDGAAWLSAALGGHRPLPWQSRLLNLLREGDVPASLDLPTGLGKTSVMAIWLVARALGAPLPRRLVYVVDRRAVVDQATTVAEQLRAVVHSTPPLQAALGLSSPLPISTLRGQFVDNREWLLDPSEPAIVVGTVDMIGSRLLFEGYGVSRRMRPYHAGLLGADALVVLDEAHLVPPFERLVEAIEQGIAANGPFAPRADGARLVPRMRLLSLSATGRQRINSFTLADADRANEIVSRRLDAKKRLTVHQPVATKELARNLADEAWRLSDGKANRVIVFATSREIAQGVGDRLEKLGGAVELFVGARRVHERTRVASWLVSHGFVADSRGQRATPTSPTFLVSTSAGEVGVDMDADHMVADLVTWERMVQRLGRVNRRGDTAAQVVIVPEEPASDPERFERVRALLLRLPQRDDSHDASPGAILELKAMFGAEIQLASSPTPLHPPLSRAALESWSMTSLEEHTGRPAVQPWIRGWIDEEEPHTTVLFRRELPIDDAGQRLADGAIAAYLDAAPPHLKEKLETETWRVIDWLAARSKSIAKERGSIGGADSDALEPDTLIGFALYGSAVIREVRLADLDDKLGRDRLSDALEGATLLLDVRIGGLRHGLLDSSEPLASDVSEAGELPFRISRIGEDQRADSGSSAYREEARLCVAATDGVETRWLVIETVTSESAESEDGRSVAPSRAQLLDEHEEWTEREARRLATRVGLDAPHTTVLTLAARLHDEGKRARNWQRAFGVGESDLRAGKAYGKTSHRPNLALLGRYRHELGSLPYAERDPRVQALPPELRDLCLHLIAAHHGYARPLLRTDGAEGPPSTLAQRAREIALRFARLEKAWGPWGLAWWEALLRAADQRASRRNEEGGAHG